jgi:xanthine/uracil/vitamin C permease (AzgA family)
VISYAAIMLLVGRGRTVDPLLYAVALALVARYVWLSG